MIIKRGDTHRIEWRANTDLTGATVRLLAKPRGRDPIVLASSVTDVAGGIVAHTLTGDLEVGTYRIELEVTQGGQIATFPNSGYAVLEVKQDLG